MRTIFSREEGDTSLSFNFLGITVICTSTFSYFPVKNPDPEMSLSAHISGSGGGEILLPSTGGELVVSWNSQNIRSHTNDHKVRKLLTGQYSNAAWHRNPTLTLTKTLNTGYTGWP